MDPKQFEKAQKLKWEKDQLVADIARAREILTEYSSFRSSIKFERERGTGHTSVSFGSKKFNFTPKMKEVLEHVLASLEDDLRCVEQQFNAL